jgi:RNA polymerase sigma-B factor
VDGESAPGTRASLSVAQPAGLDGPSRAAGLASPRCPRGARADRRELARRRPGDDDHGRQQEPGGPRDHNDPVEAHLERSLREFAALAPSDPRRTILRHKLVYGYLPVARHIARGYAGRGEPLDDLIQVATLGLILAFDRFDPRYRNGFLAFAVPTIRGELRRHFRDRCWSLRVTRRLRDLHVAINMAVDELSHTLGHAPRPSEIADLLGISRVDVLEGLRLASAHRASSLDETLWPDPDSESRLGDQLGEPDPAFEVIEDRCMLAPLLAELPERERAILAMRFYTNMSQTQIAAQLGLSQMHVSRLLAATLARLRRHLLQD